MADIMEVNPDNSPVTIPLPRSSIWIKIKKSVSIHSDTLFFIPLQDKNTVINDMKKHIYALLGILYFFSVRVLPHQSRCVLLI